MKQVGGASLDESDVIDLNANKQKGTILYAKNPPRVMAAPGIANSNSEHNLGEGANASDRLKSERVLSKSTIGQGSSQLSQKRIQNPHYEIPNDDILHDSESKSMKSNRSIDSHRNGAGLLSPEPHNNELTLSQRKLRSTTLQLSPPKVVDRPPSRNQG